MLTRRAPRLAGDGRSRGRRRAGAACGAGELGRRARAAARLSSATGSAQRVGLLHGRAGAVRADPPRAAARPAARELDPVVVSASNCGAPAGGRARRRRRSAGRRRPLTGERELRAWERARGGRWRARRSAWPQMARSRCTARISSCLGAGPADRHRGRADGQGAGAPARDRAWLGALAAGRRRRLPRRARRRVRASLERRRSTRSPRASVTPGCDVVCSKARLPIDEFRSQARA